MKQALMAIVGLCALNVNVAYAQTARVIDLGGGLYQATGVMGGAAVRVPQSNTFLIVTNGGNVVVDTSLAAVAGAHKAALTAMNSGADSSDRLDARSRRPHRRHQHMAAA